MIQALNCKKINNTDTIRHEWVTNAERLAIRDKLRAHPNSKGALSCVSENLDILKSHMRRYIVGYNTLRGSGGDRIGTWITNRFPRIYSYAHNGDMLKKPRRNNTEACHNLCKRVGIFNQYSLREFPTCVRHCQVENTVRTMRNVGTHTLVM